MHKIVTTRKLVEHHYNSSNNKELESAGKQQIKLDIFLREQKRLDFNRPRNHLIQ